MKKMNVDNIKNIICEFGITKGDILSEDCKDIAKAFDVLNQTESIDDAIQAAHFLSYYINNHQYIYRNIDNKYSEFFEEITFRKYDRVLKLVSKKDASGIYYINNIIEKKLIYLSSVDLIESSYFAFKAKRKINSFFDDKYYTKLSIWTTCAHIYKDGVGKIATLCIKDYKFYLKKNNSDFFIKNEGGVTYVFKNKRSEIYTEKAYDENDAVAMILLDFADKHYKKGLAKIIMFDDTIEYDFVLLIAINIIYLTRAYYEEQFTLLLMPFIFIGAMSAKRYNS